LQKWGPALFEEFIVELDDRLKIANCRINLLHLPAEALNLPFDL